jgi:hypothetical protein
MKHTSHDNNENAKSSEAGHYRFELLVSFRRLNRWRSGEISWDHMESRMTGLGMIRIRVSAWDSGDVHVPVAIDCGRDEIYSYVASTFHNSYDLDRSKVLVVILFMLIFPTPLPMSSYSHC